MVVAPTKTKLLLVSTKEMARRRALGTIEVEVGGPRVTSTPSERLLGMTLEHHLSWTPHIRGETWRPSGDNEPGVVSKLTRKVTAVKRLMWSMSATQLRAYIEGTVNAVIQYCLPVYANSWGVGGGGSTEGHMTLCTKDDMTRLQVLHNKALRCLVRRSEGTPWEDLRYMGTKILTEKTQMMSVNQMAAMSTLMLLKKMRDNKKPNFVMSRTRAANSRHNSIAVVRSTSHQLKLTSEGFMERACRLWNAIPVHLKGDLSANSFKKEAKIWVKLNVPAKIA